MSYKKVIYLILLLTGIFVLASCQNDGNDNNNNNQEVAQATEVVEEEATDTPEPTDTATPEPTDTPEPTETPIPTDTPEPTDTPTATPTDTPEPTDTPTPTDTPEPTNTPLPTNTPGPTNTPAPTVPPPPTNTPTPDPDAAPEFITLYYASNPSEALGTFPVRPFDANALYGNMLNVRSGLWGMRDAIPAIQSGDPAACGNYIASYEAILYNGVFYDDVPQDWVNIDLAYVLSFIYSLDRTRPAYLSCVNAGTVDDFNANLAYGTIDQTLNLLEPAIAEAAGKL